jgi:DNA-binding response OmpR family regulator
MTSLRAQIADLPTQEALEYVLSAYEQLATALIGEEPHPVDKLVPGMTPQQRRILITMYDAPGKVFTHADLLEAATFDAAKDTYANAKQFLRVQIFHLREQVPTAVGLIKTQWSRGYSFVPAQGA